MGKHVIFTWIALFSKIYNTYTELLAVQNQLNMYIYIIQCVIGFLVDDCVPMDTYMTNNSCKNNMLTHSSKAFYKFQLFLEWKGFANDALDDINVHIKLILHSK
jgi:hypothetical protein